MTVEDNLLAALALKKAPGLFSSLGRSHTRRTREEVREYLEQVDIVAFAKVKAGDLSLGYMRRLEIARALALQPILLMLDEPCAGLSKDATHDFIELAKKLQVAGTTIMLGNITWRWQPIVRPDDGLGPWRQDCRRNAPGSAEQSGRYRRLSGRSRGGRLMLEIRNLSHITDIHRCCTMFRSM